MNTVTQAGFEATVAVAILGRVTIAFFIVHFFITSYRSRIADVFNVSNNNFISKSRILLYAVSTVSAVGDSAFEIVASMQDVK